MSGAPLLLARLGGELSRERGAAVDWRGEAGPLLARGHGPRYHGSAAKMEGSGLIPFG